MAGARFWRRAASLRLRDSVLGRNSVRPIKTTLDRRSVQQSSSRPRLLLINMAVRAEYWSSELQSLAGGRAASYADTRSSMTSALTNHYRCPEDFLQFDLAGPLSNDRGYFRFGSAAIAYGTTSAGERAGRARDALYDVAGDVVAKGSTILLPFSAGEVIDNLRCERYAVRHRLSELSWDTRLMRKLYYGIRPWMGVEVRKHLQRIYLGSWEQIAFPRWPVDTTVEDMGEQLLLASMRAKGVDSVPFVWFWPEGVRGAVIMTHDVEAQAGYDFCGQLMSIDESFGINASFQIVPEGSYRVGDGLLQDIRDRGHEINVQDLNHDGRLFAEQNEFLRRARKINDYGRRYKARGFRAAVLYRNLDWYPALEFSYDMTVPNVAHLDPQRGGCCTVLPYFVGDMLELPLTTIQDYMLFNLLGDYSLDLWKTQTERILAKNGLVSFLVHPDYIVEEKERQAYRNLLSYLEGLRSREPLWFALPREVDEWWRERSRMRVVNRGGQWSVEGPGAERAVVAFARDAGSRLEYEVTSEVKVLHGKA
jgi:hypothetical protein